MDRETAIHAAQRVDAEQSTLRATQMGELARKQDFLAERFGQSFNTRCDIHRLADHCEVEARVAPDIAIEHFADVQSEPEPNLGLPDCAPLFAYRVDGGRPPVRRPLPGRLSECRWRR